MSIISEDKRRRGRPSGELDGKAVLPIGERTFHFALEIIRLCQRLNSRSDVERAIGRQVLRSGTSIGANVEEAQAGQSKADFISKNAIALKEARETLYWLRLAAESEIADKARLQLLIKEAAELSRILGAIVLHARRNRS